MGWVSAYFLSATITSEAIPQVVTISQYRTSQISLGRNLRISTGRQPPTHLGRPEWIICHSCMTRPDILVAPEWLGDKSGIIREIEDTLEARNTHQGALWGTSP